MKKLQRSLFSGQEFRAEKKEDEVFLTGEAIVYNAVSFSHGFSEEILPGAVQESLKRIADLNTDDDCACLFNHDPAMIIARTPSTLNLIDGEKSLNIEAKSADTTLANDLIKNIEAENIRGMSFGFYILDEDVEMRKTDEGIEYPHFKIKEIELFEVSFVTWPFYKQTSAKIKRGELVNEKELEERLQAHKPKVVNTDQYKRAKAYLQHLRASEALKRFK